MSTARSGGKKSEESNDSAVVSTENNSETKTIPAEQKDNWVIEAHIHDHDGCYDLLHGIAGAVNGQYKKIMKKEGNFLTDLTLKCGGTDKK